MPVRLVPGRVGPFSLRAVCRPSWDRGPRYARGPPAGRFPPGGARALPPHKRAPSSRFAAGARLAVPARVPPRPGDTVLRAGPLAGLSTLRRPGPGAGSESAAKIAALRPRWQRGPLRPGAGASALCRQHVSLYCGPRHTLRGGKVLSPRTPLSTLPKKSASRAIPKTPRAKQLSPPTDSEGAGAPATAVAHVTSRMECCSRFPGRSRANARAAAKCALGELAR
jgi:hypothetical protein